VAGDATDRAAHETGLERAVRRSRASLDPEALTTVDKEAEATDAYTTTPRAGQLLVSARVLRARHPETALGHPADIHCPPRPGTPDGRRIARLARAATIMIQLIVASRDADLAQVFGAANVGTAKQRYRRGAYRMLVLARSGRIYTDRSGYHEEAGIAGSS